jgi:hypothetical protein
VAVSGGFHLLRARPPAARPRSQPSRGLISGWELTEARTTQENYPVSLQRSYMYTSCKADGGHEPAVICYDSNNMPRTPLTAHGIQKQTLQLCVSVETCTKENTHAGKVV